MVVDADEDEIVQPRAADIHEEAGVFLLIDQGIGTARADGVKDGDGAVVGVELGVEKAFGRAVPRAAARVADRVRQVRAGGKIARLDGEEFRTIVIK